MGIVTAYRRPLLDTIQAAGHQIVLVQDNRDLLEAGLDLRDQYEFDDGFPDLDALVLEWRSPLPGHDTTTCGSPGHTCDLHRQEQLLLWYTQARKTPTLIWDPDRRLTADDPIRRLPQVRVAEYAFNPTPGAITITCPVPDVLLDHADPAALAARHRPLPLVYVGDQDDHDTAFEKYFAPAATEFDHRVAGNWTTTSRWPHVTFTGRCTFSEVVQIHAGALATVWLPDRYARLGYQTCRLTEAVIEGCLPLTPADTAIAEWFTPKQLHVHNGDEVIEKLRWLQSIHGTREHQRLIAACLLRLRDYRLSAQTETLLGALRELTESGTARAEPVPASTRAAAW